LATGDGIRYHKITITEEHHKNIPATKEIIYRQVYWARYVDWSITTPLLLLDLALLAGLSGANILVAIVADVIMVLTALFAAYGRGDGQKWGWYTIACIAYLTVVYQLAYNGLAAVAGKDSKTKAFYRAIGSFTLLVWTIYPMFVVPGPLAPQRLLTFYSVWGVASGAHIASVDTEIIVYAVLDVLAKPVFGFWLIFIHDSMSST
jgi:bacteriorhodopsin